MKILRTADLDRNLNLGPTGHEVGLLFTGHEDTTYGSRIWASGLLVSGK